MALLFIDSFDHYVTADLGEKWTTWGGTQSISAGTGRRGSASLRSTGGAANYALKGVAVSGATAILGFAFNGASLGGNRIAGIYDGPGAKEHVYLTANSDGSLSVYRSANTIPSNGTIGATLLGSTAAGLIAAGTFAYLEWKVLLHDTTGTVAVRVNGASALALTGQDTSNGSLVWSSFWLGSGSSNLTADFDDLYVLDGTGAAPWNDFLGDCRVDARYPTAAGATTGWTPNTGANWAAVDDAAPNDDTDYTSAATAGLTDTFVVQDAPVTGAAIYGVQHNLSAKKTDAGSASIAPVIRHSGVDYVGANLNPGTTYAVLQQIAAVNPGTAAAWTEAGFNAAEFGYKRTG